MPNHLSFSSLISFRTRAKAGRYLITAALILFAGISAQADGQTSVHVYPPAQGEPLSTQFTVQAEGQAVPVYLASVLAMSAEKREKAGLRTFDNGDLGQTSFASFDLQGEARLDITTPSAITSAKVLPSSLGIVPQVTGSTVTFAISKPGQFVLEINGDTVHCLQIFANPVEADVPDAKDPNVIYFGPGVHKVTSIKVNSGQTVYVAGDAVIYTTPDGPKGPVFDLHGDNITLRGRGIIDGSLCPHGARNMICAEGHNITIEGVILRDSGEWNVPITGADHVSVDDIKIFGFRGNSDGIDINGSRDVDVRDCYFRTADDLVTIKTKIPGKGPTRNVTVEHCVLWNELAQALIVGGEMREPVDNIQFSDCDIIHDMGRTFLLSVAQCDSALVTHVSYKNIRIEECRRLINVAVEKAGIYGRDPERGHIDGVSFDNITSTTPNRLDTANTPARLLGLDSDHLVQNVSFDHVVIEGHPLASGDVSANEFVKNTTITP